MQWAKRIGIDGLCLDAVKHLETVWLTDVRSRINAEVAWDQRFYMVGERRVDAVDEQRGDTVDGPPRADRHVHTLTSQRAPSRGKVCGDVALDLVSPARGEPRARRLS